MDNVTIIIQEYNNLWQEKIAHKESIRKFNNYLTYLASITSLAATFAGINFTEIISKNKNTFSVEPQQLALLLCVFLGPIIMVVCSFLLNDLYQIYVLGSQIGALEKKINLEAGDNKLLQWEHGVCPVVYGGSRKINGKPINPLTNIIKINNGYILYVFVGLVLIISIVASIYFLIKHVHWLTTSFYIALIIYLAWRLIVAGIKLYSYTKADSKLSETIQMVTLGTNHKPTDKAE